MSNINTYINNCYEVSKLMTKNYSTSFSLATRFLEKEKRNAIYAIYGFVRLCDEIVDSFHEYEKLYLLEQLINDLNYALEKGISTNLILASFANTVKKNNIDYKHIQAFLKSMRFDIEKTNYKTSEEMNEYIYGSADVVGLMCLKVFCNNDSQLYQKLERSARSLGSAFQKVNFIRDLKADLFELKRSYFPEITSNHFNHETKCKIEQSIEIDFKNAYPGIKNLPGRSKLAVALAYYYYLTLFKKIRKKSPDIILTKRTRISNLTKYIIIAKVFLLYKLKIL